MGLIAPWFLALAGVIIPSIIVLYMLKLRREERPVSSTLLWGMLMRDVEANTPWQRLRRNLLLLLQLLIALFLLLALARPFLRTEGIGGRNLILLIDRSASMGATDVGPTRLEAAKDKALELVDQLPDGGRATVIAFGGEMEVPAAATSDRRELKHAVSGIELWQAGDSDMSQALSLAGALAARSPDSEVAILSDGEITVPVSATVPGKIRYFPIGTSNNNQAIASLTLESSGPGAQTLFARVSNEGQREITRRLLIEVSYGSTEDFQLLNAYDLTVLPGANETVSIEVDAQVRLARARLEGGDDLPGDDYAWAVKPSDDPIPVRLVTPGNRFLAIALSLMPQVQVTAYLTETAAFTDTPELTILDEFLPDPLPPGNLLIIDPPRSTQYFSVTDSFDRPIPRPIASEDPILRHVTLGEVNVLRAAHVQNAPWAHTVIDSDGGPLLLAGEVAGRRIAIIAFDLHESDLPLNPAFPLLVSNLIGYLAPGIGGESALVRPGEPLAIPLGQQANEVRITFPDGSTDSISPQDGVAVIEQTRQVGIYSAELLRDGEVMRTLNYVANPYSESESHITPITLLTIREAGGGVVGRELEQEGRDEWWRPLAMLALLILIVEWLVAHRGGLARLRRRMAGV